MTSMFITLIPGRCPPNSCFAPKQWLANPHGRSPRDSLEATLRHAGPSRRFSSRAPCASPAASRSNAQIFWPEAPVSIVLEREPGTSPRAPFHGDCADSDAGVDHTAHRSECTDGGLLRSPRGRAALVIARCHFGPAAACFGPVILADFGR